MPLAIYPSISRFVRGREGSDPLQGENLRTSALPLSANEWSRLRCEQIEESRLT